jgi:hypothetical protein
MEEEAKASNPHVEGLRFQLILDDQMRRFKELPWGSAV